jgi:Tol biopolymer transport system component
MKFSRIGLATAATLYVATTVVSWAQAPATARQLTTGTLAAKEGDWSPDNKWVVFQRESDGYGNANIWKVNILGTKELQLTRNYYCDSKPRWSVKGQIAFQRDENRETVPLEGNHTASIWIMNSDGTGQKRVVKYRTDDSGGASWPIWNAAGTKIAFDYGSAEGKEVWWVNPDRTGLRKVVGVDFGEDPHGKDKSWKPAGSGANVTLAISLNHLVNGYWHIARVGTYYPKTWMTDVSVDQCQFVPCYSADGKRILYKDDETGYGNIWVMSDGGMGKIRLTDSDSTGACYTTPTWFPDGRYIAYWSNEGVADRSVSNKRMWVMTADGTRKMLILDDDGNQASDHNAMIRINRTGTKILYNREDEGGVDQVFVLELDVADDDGDGLKNWQEDLWGTDRSDDDSNDDGVTDGKSVLWGIDPAPTASSEPS